MPGFDRLRRLTRGERPNPGAAPKSPPAPVPEVPAEPAPSPLDRPRLADGVTPVALADVDELIRHAQEIERDGTFTDRVEFLAGHQLVYDPGAMPADPFSEEYRLAQIALYERLAGVDAYVPEINERMDVDIAARLRQPAPFDAGSTVAAGDHLIAYGFILRLLDLAPGSRLIEYGAGQGNISVLLATIGVDVTAIDISPGYVELIRRRAEQAELPLRSVLGQFGDPPPGGDRVDAILFYEAFHHASDHRALIRTLRDRLKPGGRVVFAGEPIIDSPVQPWIGPWGVRLDGVSLWAIRQHGCLELGYSSPYFREVLERDGFAVEFKECGETAIGNTWIATPTN